MSGTPAGGGVLVNEQAWRAPAPGLRDFVDSYVGFRQAGVEPARHRGLPSPSMTLIFTLDDPLVIAAHPDRAQPPGIFETLVGGLHQRRRSSPTTAGSPASSSALSPLGARTLLGFPASELAGFDVPAEDVLGPVATEIQDRLRCANGWARALRGPGRDAASPSRSGRPTMTAGVATKSVTPGGGCCGLAARLRSASWRPRPAGVTGTCGPDSGQRLAWRLRLRPA